MKHGLSDVELEKLNNLFARYDEIDQVILYGSRAKGNYKPFSDIDITLVGKHLTRSLLNQITSAIDDLLLPYEIDLSLFNKLTNSELIDHIHRKGIVIYKKQNSNPG